MVKALAFIFLNNKWEWHWWYYLPCSDVGTSCHTSKGLKIAPGTRWASNVLRTLTFFHQWKEHQLLEEGPGPSHWYHLWGLWPGQFTQLIWSHLLHLQNEYDHMVSTVLQRPNAVNGLVLAQSRGSVNNDSHNRWATWFSGISMDLDPDSLGCQAVWFLC